MNNQHYPFTLEPLPYDQDALDPVLDARTLSFHHGKHLATYVNNLNLALEKYPQYHKMTLRQLIMAVPRMPKELQNPVRNNAGGVYNHNLYFEIMTPGGSDKPIGALATALEKQIGLYEEVKLRLEKTALAQFGSGWAWLVTDQQGRLHILNTPNQDTPPLGKCQPLLALDVWEHAYYLMYQNRRADYVDAWMTLINWNLLEERYRVYLNL